MQSSTPWLSVSSLRADRAPLDDPQVCPFGAAEMDVPLVLAQRCQNCPLWCGHVSNPFSHSTNAMTIEFNVVHLHGSCHERRHRVTILLTIPRRAVRRMRPFPFREASPEVQALGGTSARRAPNTWPAAERASRRRHHDSRPGPRPRKWRPRWTNHRRSVKAPSGLHGLPAPSSGTPTSRGPAGRAAPPRARSFGSRGKKLGQRGGEQLSTSAGLIEQPVGPARPSSPNRPSLRPSGPRSHATRRSDQVLAPHDQRIVERRGPITVHLDKERGPELGYPVGDSPWRP